MSNRDTFIQAYITAALWSSIDDEDRPLDSGEFELAPEARATMEQEAGAFYDAHAETIENAILPNSRAENPEAAGHDFWLTRNGHGAGFWDGDWPEPAATLLDTACKRARSRDLYIGDDKLIYQM